MTPIEIKKGWAILAPAFFFSESFFRLLCVSAVFYEGFDPQRRRDAEEN